MILSLAPIDADPDGNAFLAKFPALEGLLKTYADYYPVIGYRPPWIGYVAFEGKTPVGSCGFKGAPRDGRVEIAYWTFEGHEGRGVAKAMCMLLSGLAQISDEKPILTARTLPEENASTHILRRHGFICTGTVIDPEDGPVWEWVHKRGVKGASEGEG